MSDLQFTMLVLFVFVSINTMLSVLIVKITS